jgi:fructoselysine-6-P-deglycase FrlB-like protein
MGYREDILDQPKALADTLLALAQPPAAIQQAGADLMQGRLKRLVLTGMGSSLHALVPALSQAAAGRTAGDHDRNR